MTAILMPVKLVHYAEYVTRETVVIFCLRNHFCLFFQTDKNIFVNSKINICIHNWVYAFGNSLLFYCLH